MKEFSTGKGSPKVHGGDQRISGLDIKLKDNEEIKFGDVVIKALSTPGHTSGSMSYYVYHPKSGAKAIFTGDTMFAGGCGRLFEGTAEQMYDSLVKKIGQLPSDTKVYCGHEYTKVHTVAAPPPYRGFILIQFQKNLAFSLSVDPKNENTREKYKKIESQKSTMPSTIGEELETNPFLRPHVEDIKKAIDLPSDTDPVQVLHKLRALKDLF